MTLVDVFTSLADKIRSKLGTTDKYSPISAIEAIDDVYDKGVADGATPTQIKTVTAGTSATTVTPDTGYALSSVTVNPTPSQTKSATPSTSAQTISPDSGKLLSSVSISAISPIRASGGGSATTSGINNTGPYVYFPYGWYPQNDATYGSWVYMTAAQAVTACPKQEKTVTASRSAQTVTPDSGKLLSKVTVNKYPDATGTYTYPANSTGGTYDMGTTNNLRYVNASNVYAKGKADGTTSVTAPKLSFGSDTAQLTIDYNSFPYWSKTGNIRYIKNNAWVYPNDNTKVAFSTSGKNLNVYGAGTITLYRA